MSDSPIAIFSPQQSPPSKLHSGVLTSSSQKPSPLKKMYSWHSENSFDNGLFIEVVIVLSSWYLVVRYDDLRPTVDVSKASSLSNLSLTWSVLCFLNGCILMINKKTVKDATNIIKTMPNVKMETFRETCLLPNMTYRTVCNLQNMWYPQCLSWGFPHFKLMKLLIVGWHNNVGPHSCDR